MSSEFEMKFTALSFAVMLLCAGLFIPLSGFAQETGASAQPDCALPPQFIDSRPDAVEQATQVSIGAALIDLRRINDPEQAVTVDLLITLGWLDPRLAMLAGCRVSANDIWNPRIEILNAGTVDARGEFAVTIAEDGKVHGQMRITGVFVTPLDIDDFPFDQQQLSLKAMSLRYTADELELVVDQAWTGQRDTLSIPDWHIGTVSASVREHFVPQLSRTYSRYEMEIPAERRHEYFVYKLILPLCMIVIMSWSLFWIHPVQIGPRMGVAVTSMLTLIAFQFAMGDLLPRVSYFTVMDRFILGSSALVFLALVEGVVTSYLAVEERKKAGRRINRIARVAFPLAFATLLVRIFVFK